MKKSLFLLVAAIFAMTSCSNDNEQDNSMINTHVTCSVDQFVVNGQTRTSVDPSNNYAITWASGDAIGIFPREGYQEPFEIPADQVGQSKASFDGGYWSLKEGLTYNAYYPFDKANFESADSKTTIPVTYLGQSQTGTACNAGAYDYTYSDWTAATGGSTNFKFHHIGAFLVITLKIPATTTYTSLTLNANSAVIPTKGTYDLTADAPAFVADASSMASSLTMTLNDFSGTAGEDATFYMMMPPCDLSSATLTITLSTSSTSCYYTLESQNIQAAHLYKVTGTPKESEVSGTIDGWVTDPTDPNLLPGKFTVAEGKQVQFAKSNLYWDGNTYHFEANQTDYQTSWDASHVSHFCWTNLTDYQSGNASYMPYALGYSYSSQSTSDEFWCGEDNPLTVDGTDGLYALTGGSSGEWYYLIYSRTNASSLYKYGVTVTNGGNSYTNCLIIAPDDFSGTLASSYTLDEVNSLGLVCMPAAGYRGGSSFRSVGSYGSYWSATPHSSSSDSAYGLDFISSSSIHPASGSSRSYGQSLRLVRGI